MKFRPAFLLVSVLFSIALIGCAGLQSQNATSAAVPPAPPVSGGSSTPHSTFVYVANNGSGNIAKFKVADDGSLTFVDLTPVPGVHWLAKIGDRFLVATQDGVGLQAFKIDSATGALTSFSFVSAPKASFSMTADESASLVYVGTDGIYGYSITDAGFSALPGSPWGVTPPNLPARFTEQVLITPFSPNLYAAFLGFRNSGNFEIIQRDEHGSLTTVKVGSLDSTWSVAAFANGKFVYSAPGVDGYRVDSSGQPVSIFGAVAPNADFIANDPAGKFLFGITQGGSTVAVSSIDSDTGMPTEVAGSPFSSQGNGTSIVRTDSEGKFVFVPNGSNFVSNSPSNTIAVFGLNNTTGMLTPVPGSPFPSQGSLPTDVAVVQPH